MGRFDLAVTVLLFALVPLPAHAYADPSGGIFFQILMPMLAGLWAIWMIFANKVRNAFAALYRKLRGAEAGEGTD
jgi:hypothetical protein